MPILQGTLGHAQFLAFNMDRFVKSLVFCAVLLIIVCPIFFIFFWSLSVILQYMAPGHPFGILKLILENTEN